MVAGQRFSLRNRRVIASCGDVERFTERRGLRHRRARPSPQSGASDRHGDVSWCRGDRASNWILTGGIAQALSAGSGFLFSSDNGADLCFWLAGDACKFSESRPVFPSANNLGSFHYLIYAQLRKRLVSAASRAVKIGSSSRRGSGAFYAPQGALRKPSHKRPAAAHARPPTQASSDRWLTRQRRAACFCVSRNFLPRGFQPGRQRGGCFHIDTI